MKIKRLIIHNIASIEDAEIDFDREPLSNDPIFLITGETGSGKTTILNAICLALYNTAPNLKQIGTAELDVNENIQTDSPQQLMRRGTSEAMVSLTFEGNNGKNYEAVWKVRRAYNKIDGKIQKTLRTLICEETHVSLEKDQDIRECIQRVVGLTFEQFCRTTMLAQGQFSKFMNSDEDEKTEILEKLTGTEIYARIGSKIYEHYKEQKNLCDQLQSEIAGAQLLGEEEKQAFRQEIVVWKEKAKELEKQSKLLEGQMKWLQEYATRQTGIHQAEQEMQQLTSLRDSGEMQQKYRLLKAWEATATIRDLMKNGRHYQEQLEQGQGWMEEQQVTYTRLRGGIAWMKKEQQLGEKQSQELQQLLESDQGNAKMYEQLSVIRNLADSIERKERSNRMHMQEVASAEKKIKLLDTNLESSARERSEAEQKLAEEQKRVEILQKETADIPLENLTQQVTQLTKALMDIKTAELSINACHEKEKEYKEGMKNLEAQKQQASVFTAQQEKDNRQLPQLEERLEALKNQYKGKAELCDHIASLRQQFEHTHICPLCGAPMDGLHTDAWLDEELQRTKDELEKAERSRDKLKGDISSRAIALSNIVRDISRLEKLMREKQHFLELAEKKAVKDCECCGLHYQEEDAGEKLKRKYQETEQKVTTYKTRLSKAREQLEAYRKAEQQFEKCRKEVERMKENARKLEEERLDARHSKQTSEELARADRTDMTAYQTALQQEIPWPLDFSQPDYRQLLEDITQRSETYHRNCRRQEELSIQLKDRQQQIVYAENSIEPLSENFAAAENTEPHPSEKLQEKIETLKKQVSLKMGEMSSLRKELERMRQDVKKYFENHPEYSEGQVLSIMENTPEQIEKYKKETEKLNAAIHNQEGAIGQLKRQLESHLAEKPEMEEDATSENLGIRKQETDAEWKQFENQAVQKSAILEDNAKRELNVREKQQKLEEVRQVRDNWHQLEEAFGGAHGDKFKRIAQSYVLRALLEKANYYLSMLSRRYELECNDGSLTINVIDNHQGGAVRNVGLLSGGEGFVVSLALALGLSVISQDKINVDTLFIDEGFGTLSNEYLEVVISTLDRLHQFGGRRVGVISHVAELANRIHTQIVLQRTGPSSSRITVQAD